MEAKGAESHSFKRWAKRAAVIGSLSGVAVLCVYEDQTAATTRVYNRAHEFIFGHTVQPVIDNSPDNEQALTTPDGSVPSVEDAA